MRRIHRFRNFAVGAAALALFGSAQVGSTDAQSSGQQSFVTTKEGASYWTASHFAWPA